jgi:hypothetical protein
LAAGFFAAGGVFFAGAGAGFLAGRLRGGEARFGVGRVLFF